MKKKETEKLAPPNILLIAQQNADVASSRIREK